MYFARDRFGPVTKRATGIAFIAVAATLWGTWPLYARGGALSGLTIGFITMAVMSLPAPFVFRRDDFADRGAVIALVLIGLADAANVFLYFSALSRGPVVVGVLTHYLAPTLVALLAPTLLREPRSRRALFAAPLVLLGLGLVLGRGDASDGWLPTAALGAGSAIFYAIVVLGSRRAGRTFGPLAVTSLHSVISALALWLCFQREALPARLDASVAVICFAALVNGLFAATLFNISLRAIGSQLVGVFTYLEPLTAALLGVLVLHEPFNALAALGVLLVIAAGGWAAAEPQRIAPLDIAEP
jgi:drug/metabolite transporter (DMT)-like permease